MIAAHYRLDNLVAIVDRNGLQITGSTEDVCQLEPLEEKFEAFSFAVRKCDGDDIAMCCARWKMSHLCRASRAWYWRRRARVKESALWIT
jgi:transketolase